MSNLKLELHEYDLFAAEKDWQPSTTAYYQYMLQRLTRWMEQNEIESFADLDILQVRRFLDQMGWGKSMTRKLNSLLCQFFKHKFGAGHALERWKVKNEVAAPQRTPDADALQTILRNFSQGRSMGYSNRHRKHVQFDLEHPLGIRNLAIVWVFINTAFRSTEVCNLELKHLDLKRKTIEGRVKGGKWRTGRFSSHTAQAIANWLEVRSGFENELSQDRLFLGVMNGYEGCPMTPSGMRALMRKMGVKCGIGALSPHDFRRSFATLSMRAGASPQAIKEAGGWTNIGMVMHYTRSIRGDEILPFLPENTIRVPEHLHDTSH